MPFDAADRAAMIDGMPNARTVTVKVNGVAVKEIRGLYRTRAEFVGKDGQPRILPALTVDAADLADVEHGYTLGVDGVDFRQYGTPLPDNSGFLKIGLVK